MKYTIAERELLAGLDQRNANAQASYKASMRNSRNAQATPIAPVTPVTPPYVAPPRRTGWHSAFDPYGDICSCIVSDSDEVQRRIRTHNRLVLPEPSDQTGYVYTRLDVFGTRGDRKLVSVRTYLTRYYLWQHKQSAMPWSAVYKRDRAAIQRIIGKRRLRSTWRCFLFGAGKEVVHAFDFSDWVIGPDGKRMRRPLGDE